MASSGTVNVLRVTFDRNTAGAQGGAILVTGGTGFVGPRFVHALRAEEQGVRVERGFVVTDEFLRTSAHNVAVAGATKSPVELDIAPFRPAQLLQRLPQHCIEGLKVRVGLKSARNHANAPRAIGLLRPRHYRPRRRRHAAKRGDEVAAPYHSITSSAIASSVGGTMRPSMRAVSTLMTSSNLLA